MAEQVAGTIKTFNPTKGFGFITSDQAEGDIYFNANSLPAELSDVDESFINLIGQSVCFNLFATPDGKHQARQIALISQDTTDLVGTVKSYSEQAGYGFLTSPSVDQDVFFKLKFVPPHMQGGLKGQVARFNLHMTEDGKAQANHVVFKSEAASPMSMMGKAGKAGKTVMMPAMSPTHWGGSPVVMPMGMKGKAAMQMPTGMMAGMMGKSAGFKGKGCAANGKAPGKSKAGMMYAPQFVPQAQALVAWAPPAHQMAPAWASPAANTIASGVVKTFNALKGFGFILSPDVAGDVFFKGDKVDGEVEEGMPVTFSLRITPDGKPQASNVTPSTACEGAEMVGSIKSFNESKGYGFVSVPGQAGDVFFKTQDLPDGIEGIGSQVRFAVHLTPDGKMQMRNASAVLGSPVGMNNILGGGVKRAAAAMRPTLSHALGNPLAPQQKRLKVAAPVADGASFECTVKSYNALKGWGFLECAEVQGDVYFQKKLLPAEHQNLDLVGMAAAFQVAYTPDGKPQAAQLELM